MKFKHLLNEAKLKKPFEHKPVHIGGGNNQAEGGTSWRISYDGDHNDIEVQITMYPSGDKTQEPNKYYIHLEVPATTSKRELKDLYGKKGYKTLDLAKKEANKKVLTWVTRNMKKFPYFKLFLQ